MRRKVRWSAAMVLVLFLAGAVRGHTPDLPGVRFERDVEVAIRDRTILPGHHVRPSLWERNY